MKEKICLIINIMKDKKNIISIILILIFVASLITVLVKSNSETSKIENNNQTTKVENNNILPKKETKKIEISNSSDLKTSVVWEGTDRELIDKNLLLENSNVSIQDRLKAKEIAEKFVEAITIVDVNNPKKSEDEAMKYIGDEQAKKQLEADFSSIFTKKDIKGVVFKSIKSWQKDNEQNNNYLLFGVQIKFDFIDNHDQNIAGGEPWYLIKLLKVGDEYKVMDCTIQS